MKPSGPRRTPGCPAPGLFFPFILLAALPLPAVAAEDLTGGPDPALKLEIQYAQGLTKWGLPDYAEIVLKRIKDKTPEAAVLIKVIEMEGMTALGKFDEVKALIAAESDQESQEAWAMKLALADGLYAHGRYAEAQGLYEGFLQKYPNGPPDSLREFFLNSAYKYAQMLILMGRSPDALRAYELVAKAVPKTDQARKHVRRQVLSETAELLAKLAETADAKTQETYFRKITDIANEILWVQDLWFGRAIVVMAHVEMMQGRVDKAQGLIDDFRKQLEEMDEILRRQEKETGEPLAKLSPMAECRYLLGVMMQDEAEKLLAADAAKNKDRIVALLAGRPLGPGKRGNGALQHFYNVFVKYSDTNWAPDAGVRANRVKEILVGLGAEVNVTIPPALLEKIEASQFQAARALFNQQQYGEAAGNYLKVVNLFPERDGSIGGLGDLARCYIETDNELFADTVIRHLAERFGSHPTLMTRAGDEMIRIAEQYGERRMPDRKDAVYELFFRYYPRHARAAGLLFRLGDKFFEKEDYAGAIKYYRLVAESYPGSPLYRDALSKIAFCQSKQGDYVAEIKTLETYSKALQEGGRPGQESAAAKYRLAAAYRQLDRKYIPNALNRYAELIKMLGDPNNPYQATPEDAEKNKSILEGAMYNKAVCYSMLTDPPEKLPAYRQEAITTLQELIQKYPKSKFAPAALSQIGTLYTVLDKPQEAENAFRRLKSDYPDSPETKNVAFLRGMSLLSLGMRQQATRVFKEMFEGGAGQYSEAQILTAGAELLKAKENEIALEAFDRVAGSKERGIREPAMMGKGQALLALGKYADAAAALEKLLSENPRSGYTVDVSLYLSQACSRMGAEEKDAGKRFDIYNRAVQAIKIARQFASAAGVQAKLDVEVGRLLARKARAEEMFGSKDKARAVLGESVAAFQSLILLADSGNPEIRPHVEEAYNECWPLMAEMARWKDLAEDSESYLKQFPSGKYVVEARKWGNKASMALVSEGGGAQPAAGQPQPGGQPPQGGTGAPPASAAPPQPAAAPAGAAPAGTEAKPGAAPVGEAK